MAMEVRKEVPQRLTITRPDDWHLHLRDDAAMRDVVGFSAEVFGRAIIMPNLTPPITTLEMAAAYRDRILSALPSGSTFQPLMTLYLTESTSPDEIRRAKKSGFIHGVKYYPAGATTNSELGVRDLKNVVPQLEAMQEVDIPFLIHGEVAGNDTDVFWREDRFLPSLDWLCMEFRCLRIVLEHVTTDMAVSAVKHLSSNVVATITPQHLLYNRNHMLGDGIRPHLYCKPILKAWKDQQALLEAATSGDSKFFLGTDSAPHPRTGDPKKAKETSCGCAGCFSAPIAMPLYMKAFEEARAIDRLEYFASRFGAHFYDLPRSTETITLERESWIVPAEYRFGENTVVPLCAGETLDWQVVEV